MRLADIEFDTVFQVDGTGNVFEVDSIYAPDVLHDDSETHADIEIYSTDWEAFSNGYTGQYGYNGPVMHQSETLSGALAKDILSSPGIYCLTSVEVHPTDDDPDPFPAGWIILKKKD